MMGFGFLGIGMLLMVLFWCAVVVGGIWLVARLVHATPSGMGMGSPTSPSLGSQAPLDVLKARYARGEISKEQYEEIKSNLER